MAAEIKQFPFEYKVNTEKRIIEGYASTFGNVDLVRDVVNQGAFKKTLEERGPLTGRKSKIKFLWQHSPWDPIGIPVKMSEDSRGLYVEARVSKTTLGNDALTLAQDGVLDSFSIGYDVVKDEYDTEKNVRNLKELKLHEFSIVTFPANPEATISGTKSLEQLQQILHKTARQDVNYFLKEGRVLSKANKQLIETAIKALEDILNISEPGEKAHSAEKTPQPLNNKLKTSVDPEEIRALLANFRPLS